MPESSMSTAFLRRWMVRENERVARKYKQQERERIAKLVSLAESSDPRVQAEKDAKRLAREAEQAKREEERRCITYCIT